jgi:hypothetical protein
MISIGGHYNGPELEGSAIDLLIRSAAKAVKRFRGDDYEAHSVPAVNVVFYVPGSLGAEGPTKIEAARFSRKQKLLLVAVPVPRDVAEAGGSIEFVIDALHRANAIATEVFAKKGVGAFDLAKAEALVEKVRQTLAAQAGETGEAGES